MQRLRNVFLKALEEHGVTQFGFAQKAGVTHSAITKFLQGSRPRDDLFRALFVNWPDEGTRRELLRAHVADEIERAGLRLSDYEKKLSLMDQSLEQDMLTLEVAMREEPTLRDFIGKTAEMFRRKGRKRGGN